MIRFFLAAIFSSLALLAFCDEPQLADSEIWNLGVDAYRNGDTTNALAILRPLMLSKSHGARAAEIVAELELARGNLEEAAAAAQVTLRADPTDERVNRNFTRASDGLAEFRRTRHINDVLKGAQGKDPAAILKGATDDARRLMNEAPACKTNPPARAVALADRLSARAKYISDCWIPVRETIVQSVTNEEQAATILQQLDQAKDKTDRAAKELSDLDPNSYSTLSDVEHDLTRFLKLTALPPAALAEDLVAQSNAWQDVEDFNGRSWQQDALDYTRSFRAKFPAWARAYEQQAQSDTNKPPFTAEDQAKVAALATELEKAQLECCEKSLPPTQEKALRILRDIQALLPKDNSGGQGQQNQQQQQQQNQNQQNQDQNQQQQQQDQQQNQDQPPPDQQQDQDPSQPQPEEKEGDEPQEQEEEKDEELEATLKKAQERNDEHEADKKARMRKSPLPPNERDW